jgi:hypothetical protein
MPAQNPFSSCILQGFRHDGTEVAALLDFDAT